VALGKLQTNSPERCTAESHGTGLAGEAFSCVHTQLCRETGLSSTLLTKGDIEREKKSMVGKKNYVKTVNYSTN